jgi:hypothetical protein
MKNVTVTISISLLLLLSLSTCKKAKLTGDYSYLVGTWQRTSGWNDNGNNDFELKLSESGKYELFNGIEKIDNGHLKTDDQKFMIISDKCQKHQYKFYDKLFLWTNNDTTIVITCEASFDCLTSTYTKEK